MSVDIYFCRRESHRLKAFLSSDRLSDSHWSCISERRVRDDVTVVKQIGVPVVFVQQDKGGTTDYRLRPFWGMGSFSFYNYNKKEQNTMQELNNKLAESDRKFWMESNS